MRGKNGGGDSVAVLAERRISLTENAVEKRGI